MAKRATLTFPEWPYTLDLECEIGRGLLFCATNPFPALGACDLINLGLSTKPTTPSAKVFGVGATGCTWATSPLLDLTTNFTVAAWFESPSTVTGAGYPKILSRDNYTNESVNTGWVMMIRDAGDGSAGYNFGMENNNVRSSYALSYNTIASGTRLLAHTTDGTTRRLYLDGQQVATSTNNPTCASSGASTTFGNVTDTTALATYWSMIWNRCLTAGEVWNLYKPDSRFDMLYKPRRRAWSTRTAAFNPSQPFPSLPQSVLAM